MHKNSANKWVKHGAELTPLGRLCSQYKEVGLWNSVFKHGHIYNYTLESAFKKQIYKTYKKAPHLKIVTLPIRC